ncbi:MAG TPA: oligosaccharide flippase family protein [Terriglobia bacterium]|jgi:O-antigen/teichoic acid export membrane protein
MPSDDSTFKPAFKLMAGRVAAFGITFLTPVLLVRVFSKAEFGTYKQFMLIMYTLFLIGQCGLAECLFYFLPKKPERGASYALNSVLMLGISGLLCWIGLLISPGRIASWMSNAALARYIPVMGAYLLFMLMGTVLEISMVARKRYNLAAATYVISDLLRAVALVVPALITRSLMWALAGSVVFFFFRVCAIFGYFRSEFKGRLHMDKALLKEQWAYALPFSLSVIVQVIQQNYHQYAVAFHFDAATFAIYSVGCLQIPLVDFMATPASNVMMVRMTEEQREGQIRNLLPIWHDTTRKLALLFFPFVGLLVVNAYRLITLLFTKSYAASVPLFMVWCLSIILTAFQTDGVLRVFAEMKFLVGINLVRLTIVLVMMSWFLSTFQLMGAVMITLVGMFVAKVMGVVRIKTLLESSLAEILPWKNLAGILMAAMVAAVPAIVLNARLALPTLVMLPLCGMAYAATYGLIVWIFGLLDEGEKASVKRILYVCKRTVGLAEPAPVFRKAV